MPVTSVPFISPAIISLHVFTKAQSGCSCIHQRQTQFTSRYLVRCSEGCLKSAMGLFQKSSEGPKVNRLHLPPPILMSRWLKMKTTWVSIRVGRAKPSEEIYEMKCFVSLFKSHDENLYLQICEGVCVVLWYEKRKLQRSRSGKVVPFTQVCLCSAADM